MSVLLIFFSSLLSKKAEEYFIFGGFLTAFLSFSTAALALMAAPVWTASTPSRVYAHRALQGITASMTSTSVTPNPVLMEAPARTATAPTNAPALMDTSDLTVR